MRSQTDLEGRAKWADAHFGKGKKKRDITGHGTHCACIAAGKIYGVAKKANICDLLDEQVYKVSAGNENIDAKDISPARSPHVITVGASDIKDGRWVKTETIGSNYGAVVDIYAPGADISSCAPAKDKTASRKDTGTSMAAPHVAGMIARRLSNLGNITPAKMKEELGKEALKDVLDLKDAPGPNLLAHIPDRW
ncbi:hypothetical protein H0H92_010878 [Tricholoma furcatifolium]|nr:hypothetical protein H0H92_010878 [Tricholoma furcatifolium]